MGETAAELGVIHAGHRALWQYDLWRHWVYLRLRLSNHGDLWNHGLVIWSFVGCCGLDLASRCAQSAMSHEMAYNIWSTAARCRGKFQDLSKPHLLRVLKRWWSSKTFYSIFSRGSPKMIVWMLNKGSWEVYGFVSSSFSRSLRKQIGTIPFGVVTTL